MTVGRHRDVYSDSSCRDAQSKALENSSLQSLLASRYWNMLSQSVYLCSAHSAVSRAVDRGYICVKNSHHFRA